MPRLAGVLERYRARRPDGTFAEALLAAPPSGAGPPAAVLPRLIRPKVDLRVGQPSVDLGQAAPGRAFTC
jgi:hypothetical protein